MKYLAAIPGVSIVAASSGGIALSVRSPYGPSGPGASIELFIRRAEFSQFLTDLNGAYTRLIREENQAAQV